MIVSRRWKAMGVCFLLFGAGVVVLVAMPRSPTFQDETESQSHPNLFDGQPRCRSSQSASTRAERMARRGRISAERYPYDPGDGIRAVSHLLEAQHCYRLAGETTEADRIRRLTTELTNRIEADYASARLILGHALKSKRWSVAKDQASRLLALTAHVGANAYVEWLRDISGKAAALAQDSP